ncbi:hypothetical protein OJ997_13190 [Solirubrobacter phytolaccae]|uniref:Uncharacterized protein n=1 Tax=Solirubrobacter phytolaccae TaxID=1404360 RepID=A0A9X3NC48_9ACTN|nr:hypothetical protein [Solirubrobacter phytolaccae]MDA0181256.1 hypothetical protein [Solirubrobacter phytolaccae]
MLRVLLVVILVGALCGTAQAAPRTVARSGEFSLQAERKDGQVCLTLRRERRYQGQECGPLPRSPHHTLSVFPDIPSNTYAVAVAPTVRRAEVEDAKGRRTMHRTFSARGFAARFVLIPRPAALFVRLYGADGTLLSMDAGTIGYIEWHTDSVPVFGDRMAGVTAYTELRLQPSPDQADRVRTLACVDVVSSSGGSGMCDDDSEDALVIMGSCDGPGLVGGVFSPAVAGVRLELGSGATVQLPVSELPAPFGGRRTLGANVPAGEAVRAATAVDAAGRELSRVGVGLAPGGQPCAGEDRGDDRFMGRLVPVAPAPGAVAVAEAAGVPLLVADQGETLCAELGQLPAQLCPPAPVDSDPPRLLRQGGTVAGVLSVDAARVTLELDRGRDVTVPTTDAPAYTGRWHGKVRFFAAAVAASRKVVRVVVRDASGRAIGIADRGVVAPRVNRRVLAEQAGVRLQVARQTGEQPCLEAVVADPAPVPRFCTDPDPGVPIDGPMRQYGGAVVVSCTPRLALAYGRFTDGLKTPSVVLVDGREVKARRIALDGEDAWYAFVPDAVIAGLRAGEDRVALNLPPASAQCGYSVSRAF